MLLCQLLMELERERYDAFRVCPQRKEPASLARRAGRDGGCLKDRNGVERGVERLVAREEVGRRAADDAAA
jgi:hypothetical protein